MVPAVASFGDPPQRFRRPTSDSRERPHLLAVGSLRRHTLTATGWAEGAVTGLGRRKVHAMEHLLPAPGMPFQLDSRRPSHGVPGAQAPDAEQSRACLSCRPPSASEWSLPLGPGGAGPGRTAELRASSTDIRHISAWIMVCIAGLPAQASLVGGGGGRGLGTVAAAACQHGWAVPPPAKHPARLRTQLMVCVLHFARDTGSPASWFPRIHAGHDSPRGMCGPPLGPPTYDRSALPGPR